MFATDFSNQHTSVSGALVRHDHQSNVEDVASHKKWVVKGIKVTFLLAEMERSL